MNRTEVKPSLRWVGDRCCIVDGCDNRAPGTHPLCRQHARSLGRDTAQLLRFDPTDELVTQILEDLA